MFCHGLPSAPFCGLPCVKDVTWLWLCLWSTPPDLILFIVSSLEVDFGSSGVVWSQLFTPIHRYLNLGSQSAHGVNEAVQLPQATLPLHKLFRGFSHCLFYFVLAFGLQRESLLLGEVSIYLGAHTSQCMLEEFY